jgi:hypothetical protein
MSAALRVLVAALAGQAAATHESVPGPRIPIAGIAAFRSVSRIDFGTVANRLTALYVFPDRARWCFESYLGDSPERQLVYRFGPQVHQLTSGAASEPMTGPGRDIVLLQMELRRAAMLWPDGFDWAAEESGARAAPVFAHSCCRRDPIGRLLASELAADGVPARIEARGSGGELVEWIALRAHQVIDGRRWPRVMEVGSGEGSFVETVESIETRVHFLDLAFLPSDQRPLARSSSEGPEVLSADLVPIAYRAHDLPESVSWEDALRRAKAWIEEMAAELGASGPEVDPVPTFELSATARPVRCWVRLREARQPVPPGFVFAEERPGLLLSLPDVDLVSPAVLRRLTAVVPPQAVAGTPYLRWHEADEPHIEIVLPLDAPH